MKSRLFVLLFAMACMQALSQEPHDPVADSKAVIVAGKARFTVLTPGLIRLEWDSASAFTDNASFVAVNRKLPVPSFTKKETKKTIEIITEKIVLRYTKGPERFSQANLSITSKDKNNPVKWWPCKPGSGNLKGTTRTLDRYNGDTGEWSGQKLELEDGLLSRDGWTVIDDSNNFLFDNSEWKWVTERKNKNGQDLYFFAYGNDYKTALYDFSLIAGKTPLPPRYAFGYWWSRYWLYSDNELRDLVRNFRRFNLPLDVLVVDMDWHTTEGLSRIPGKFVMDEFGQKRGWTGYTWNKNLFPNPARFLEWTEQMDLKTTFNLHPASGIAPNEEKYAAVAKALHFDTTGGKNVPYECADKDFMRVLFDSVLHPLEKKGMDFWWLDWQQWPNSKQLPALSNTWWLNYCFFTDMERQQQARPILFHRWGGLGNHRYQIGFSGDVVISWKSLAYQPYFTATASNVLYSYWSHDIGGHMFGNIPEEQKILDPELYTRWMQFGAFSPVFRTHSAKDRRLNREPWEFGHEYEQALNDVIHLRYAMAPYIYTMARKTYDSSISLCRPLYHDYPTASEAYEFANEYMFGDHILVAPVASPAENNFSKVKIWLPPGNDWYEWHTGTMLKGGEEVERNFTLDEIPVYVKSGAIIPMYSSISNLKENPGGLIVKIFPGGNFSSVLYEDEGNNDNYKSNRYAVTSFSTSRVDDRLLLKINPRKGQFDGMLTSRRYEVQLPGTVMPAKVMVNDVAYSYSLEAIPGTWTYSGDDLTAHIHIPESDCRQPQTVSITFSNDTLSLAGIPAQFRRLKKAVTWLKYNWIDLSDIPAVISCAETANRRLEYAPEDFKEIIKQFRADYAQIARELSSTHLTENSVLKFLHFLEAQ